MRTGANSKSKNQEKEIWSYSKIFYKKNHGIKIYLDNNTSERLRLEESLKLKENILQTYRKQIDTRRALLEIDTGLMDVIHECARNESVIE